MIRSQFKAFLKAWMMTTILSKFSSICISFLNSGTKISQLKYVFRPVKLNPLLETAFILRTSGTTGFNKGVLSSTRGQTLSFHTIAFAYMDKLSDFDFCSKKFDQERHVNRYWINFWNSNIFDYSLDFSAICISHASVLHKMKALNGIFRPSDVLLKFLSFDGVSGIRYLLGPILNGSMRMVNTGPFSPLRFFKFVERFRVTIVHTSAFTVSQILKHPKIETANLDSLRLIHYGGASIPFATVRKTNSYLRNGKICAGYGLTESFGTVACNLEHAKNNCAGQLIGGYVVKIVNDYGERLGVNQTGEICIKFPFPFPGYLRLAQNIDVFVDNEGFFMTGDEGRFDGNGDSDFFFP